MARTQAEEWAKEEALQVLQGEAKEVVANLRRSATRGQLAEKEESPRTSVSTILLNTFPCYNTAPFSPMGCQLPWELAEMPAVI